MWFALFAMKMSCQLLQLCVQHQPQGLSTQDCLRSEGSQLLSAVKASSLLLPFCWARPPLTCSQQLSKEPSACWHGSPLASSSAVSTIHGQNPALWESLWKSEMRESAPTKPPVKKQSLSLMCKKRAGTPLIYMCADRWSDLKYSLQIPSSLRKVAGS